jgi:hypothetical protein
MAASSETFEQSPWTSWRLAGCILLILPVSMLLFSLLNQVFHFTQHSRNSPADIGVIFVTWFGISLARGNTVHRGNALLLSCLYVIAFTALAVFGPLMNPADRKLTLFIPILHPEVWHYLIIWVFGMVFFGIPALLLFRENQKGLTRRCS